MKTGHTDSAGFCLVTSAKRDNMRLVSVVMGSSSIKGREDASSALLNYGYTFYETGQVMKAGEALLKAARLQIRRSGTCTLTVPRDIVMTVGRGQLANLKRQRGHLFKEPLVAPLAANRGHWRAHPSPTRTERVVSHVPLTPGKAVPEAGLWTPVPRTACDCGSIRPAWPTHSRSPT